MAACIKSHDAVRLLYLVASVKASSNEDNWDLCGRECKDHCFGLFRATIFRRLQAELGLLHAVIGAQQCHDPDHFQVVLLRIST
jgi:hypothetical protein